MRVAERVLLSSIKTLTLFADEDTFSRRTDPIPQLTCIGQVCKLYQPQAVLCTNIGGRGTEVNWKCEADLPETLRFGKVTVSCEGWSRSGDPHVLDGSCGLEYKLVRVPKVFQPTFDEVPSVWRRMVDWIYPDDLPTLIFSIVWLALLSYFLWSVLRSCIRAHREANPPHSRRSQDGGTIPRGGGGGSYPGAFSSPHNDSPPPPPYTKHTTASDPSTTAGRWTPGFWTGLGLGGLAASLWNRNRADSAAEALARQRQYDWERARLGGAGGGLFGRGGIFGSRWGTPPLGRSQPSPPSQTRHETSGAGPSGLGQMRSSTGLGGSHVR
ncbi:hypothetical protein BS47DRAFT_1326933 [Hydnum rufescens UP504]|uniref:Store-operated calcium entry-associated regulatory factor n=1 Tax=Hydnum rufescens UP504 TaxID=1448309 RepID=A0A9P6E0G1_9AGAM|nr:hypothetical protein BS47DRAFT_1326933 [Hydnum rufescens UP504]